MDFQHYGKIDFSKCVNIAVKLITSIAGDSEQQTHTDFAKEVNSLINLSQFHYSAIVSLEENTRLLIGPLRVSVDISLHSMLLSRGDMEHAGAAYSVNCSYRHLVVAEIEKGSREQVGLITGVYARSQINF